MGPTTPGVARVKGKYRLSLVVMYDSRKVIEMLNSGFEQILRDYSNIQMRVDVDPTNLI